MAGLVDSGIEILLGLHEGFRSTLDGLIDDLRAGSNVIPEWDGFVRDLHDHHRHEDDEIFPQVRAALGAEVTATFVAMDAEHEALVRALERADAFVRANGAEALEATLALRTVLRDHLAHEEGAAVPFIRRALDDDFMTAFFGRRQAEMAVRAGSGVPS